MNTGPQYPTCRYHWTGKSIVVQNASEDAALEPGWADTPAAFEPYIGLRQPKTPDQDTVKWVDAWVVPSLSSEQRDRIKGQLLRADAAFWRSPDGPSSTMDAMRQAFAGIAQVLSNAGLLTTALLKDGIPALVWDAAISGGWYGCASETFLSIFPERVGHNWLWRDEAQGWKNLFYSEEREWFAWLLENPSKDALEANERVSATEEVSSDPVAGEGDPASSGDDPRFDFTSAEGRNEAMSEYTQHWTCSAAALARKAIVFPGDLSKWKKGGLPAESDKKRRIERVITNNEPPTPVTKKSNFF